MNYHHRLRVLFFAICLLFAFTLLSKFEDRQIMRNIDFAATVKLQDKIDKSAHLRLAALVDNLMEGATFFAGPEFTSIAVLLLTVFAFRKKKWRALLILLFFAAIVLAELYGKTVVHHPSPPFSMIKHTTSVFPANYVNEQFSYPSGHAARAVFLGFVVYLSFSIQHLALRRRLQIALVGSIIGYIVLVGISRIYLGHHWLSDVAGGILLGGGMGLLTLGVYISYNSKAMSD